MGGVIGKRRAKQKQAAVQERETKDIPPTIVENELRHGGGADDSVPSQLGQPDESGLSLSGFDDTQSAHRGGYENITQAPPAHQSGYHDDSVRTESEYQGENSLSWEEMTEEAGALLDRAEERIERTRSDGVVRVKVATTGRGRVELGCQNGETEAADSAPRRFGRQRSRSFDDAMADMTLGDSTRLAYAMLLREMSNSTENSEPSSEFQEMLAHMHERARGAGSLRGRQRSEALTDMSSATSESLERMLRELSAKYPESPLASLTPSDFLRGDSASTTASSTHLPRFPHRHSFGGRSALAREISGGWTQRLGGDRALAQQLEFLRSVDGERRIKADAKTPRSARS